MLVIEESTSMKMFEKLSSENELTFLSPCTLASSSSMGIVIVRSISSAMPVAGSSVVIRMRLLDTSGNKSSLSRVVAVR